MREDDKHQDISYICLESHTNRSDVEKVIFSHKLSHHLSENKVEVNPELFFGLLIQDTLHKNIGSNIFFSNIVSNDITKDPQYFFCNNLSIRN